MSKKIFVTLLIIIAFMVLFTACERPASKAPVEIPATGDAIKTPLPVDQQILNATMTAQAIMEKFNQPTPSFGDAKTETPVEVETQAPAETVTEVPAETPTPTPVTELPDRTIPSEHSIKQGETAYCLARRYNLNIDDLQAANSGLNLQFLSVGDKVIIPQNSLWPSGVSRALNPHPDTWTVDPGDTIYKIACWYGDVYPEDIILVNGLQAPYTLTVGDTLQIP